MFCPNFKNKEVFEGFNLIIEALGGRAMTEEEFRDGDLRNQRSGANFDAMDLAYMIWDANNGNPLNYAPNGNESKLYNDLLSAYNGDVMKATKAKALLYTLYFRDWFGDWLSEDKTNVSKVVDENGEPLVVYHNGGEDINIFKGDEFGNIYFGDFITSASYGGTEYVVFLNIKSPTIVEGNNQEIGDATEKTYGTRRINPKDNDDGVIYNHVQDVGEGVYEFDEEDVDRFWNDYELQGYGTVYSVNNPNQIKSINNNGTFSKFDNNVYHAVLDELQMSPAVKSQINLLKSFDPVGTIGEPVMSRLKSGKVVNSREIVSNILMSGTISGNSQLSNALGILGRHDIPVRMVKTSVPVAMSALTTKKGTVIYVNELVLDKASNEYIAETFAHELIHALTVDALENPVTDFQKEFARATKSAFESAKRQIKWLNIPAKFDHAFENEKEFSAYLASNKLFKNWLYSETAEKRGLNSTIKRAINAIARLIINRNVFNVETTSQLRQYEKQLLDFINEVPYNKEILTAEEMKAVYDSIDPNNLITLQYLDSVKLFRDMVGASVNHQTLEMEVRDDVLSVSLKIDNTCRDILQILKKRQLALRSSMLPIGEKDKLLFDVNQQIAQFENNQISKYWDMITLVRQTSPQIVEDIKRFNKILEKHESMSNTELQYHIHDNIAAYSKIFSEIHTILRPGNEASIGYEELIQDALEKGENITKEHVDLLDKQVESIQSILKTAEDCLESIRTNNVLKILENLSKKENTGSKELLEYFKDYIEVKGNYAEDISWYQLHLGAADSSTNPLIRGLDYMVRKANQKVEDAIYNKSVDLLKLQKELGSDESVFDCYETDENGETTGYLVRQRNYGMFYRNYNNAVDSINEYINKLYGTDLKKSNRHSPLNTSITITSQIVNAVKEDLYKLDKTGALFDTWNNLPDTDKVRYHWFTKRNYWLGDNCDRRYKTEYYQAWASLSQEIADRMLALNLQISAILNQPGIRDENGFPRLDRLTDEKRKELDELKLQKRFLKSDRDEFGDLKTGVDLQHAKEVQRFYEILYGKDKKTIQRNKEAWIEARLDVISECGGVEAYQKYKNGEKDHGFDYQKLDNWDKYNSNLEMKQDEAGNWLILNKINELAGGFEISYGEQYDALKQEMNDILKPYRQGGQYRPSLMTEKVKNRLVKLSKQMTEIQKMVTRNNPALKKASSVRGELFKEFVEFTPNDDFVQMRNNQLMQIMDILDDDLAVMAVLSQFGTPSIDFTTGNIVGVRYHKWFTRMIASAKYRDDYMELNPSDSWVDFHTDNTNINDWFDEKENVTWVPKLSKYNNTEQYKKVTLAGSALNKYYEEIKRTIHESNEMQTGRGFCDDYMLPQITCTALEQTLTTHKNDNKWNLMMYHLKKNIGVKEDEDDVQLHGQTGVFSLDQEGKKFDSKEFHTYGSRADDKKFNVIPLSYVAKMEKPEYISRELTMITLMYYGMSLNFKEKSAIKDDCETIYDTLKSAQYRDGNVQVATPKTPQMAEQYLKFNLYGQDYARDTRYGFDYTKTLALVRKYTTAKNLGMNPKVAMVGMLSSLFAHNVNMVVGQKYSASVAMLAGKEVLTQTLSSALHGFNVSNPLSNNKLIGVLEFLNVGEQGTKKYRNPNKTLSGATRFAEAIRQNWCFGMMTTCDFISKSNVATSTIMSYRLVDGKFITQDDIRMNRTVASIDNEELQEIWEKDQMEKWKEGVCLWDVLNMKDGRLQCDPQYTEAFEEVKHEVISRAQNYCESADGMALKTQKTAFAHNIWGAFCMIHRQYLPLMLGERFGKRVYDFNTHQYKNGQWRTLGKLLGGIALESRLGSILAGGFFGNLLMSTYGIGAIGGSIVGLYLNHKYGNTKFLPSLNKIVRSAVNLVTSPFIKGSMRRTLSSMGDKTTGDTKYEALKNNVNYQMDRYQIKQVLVEVAFVLILNLLAGLVGGYADDDKDDKLLNFVSLVLDGALWESMSPYNLADIIQTIKSPSASLGVVDSAMDVAKEMGESGMLLLQGMRSAESTAVGFMDLFGFLEALFGGSAFAEVQKGAYEGETKLSKAAQKMTPWKNLKEQFLDSYGKRRWIENKQFEEAPSRMLYDILESEDVPDEYEFSEDSSYNNVDFYNDQYVE